MKHGQIAQLVQAIAPSLGQANIRCAGMGECYQAWWVGEEHIFRVPLDKGEERALEVEMAVLPRLAQTVDAMIPVPQFLGRDTATGVLGLGHRAVLGKPLTVGRLAGLTDAKRQTLAAHVAQFFTQLRQYPLAAVGVELPLVADLYGPDADLAAVKELVFPRMEEQDVAACMRMAERFQLCPTADWSLVHGDLGPEHIYLDGEDRFVGVIDFGNLSRGDPSFDLSAMIYGAGLQFAKEILIHMAPGRAEEELVRARTRCIWEFLTWGAEELGEGHTEEVDREIPKISGLIAAEHPWWC